MSDVTAFLNQHPGFRERVALVGLFQGYVSAPVLAGISARSAAAGAFPSVNEVSWTETLQPLHQAGLLQQAQENSAYIPAATAQSLHDLLAEYYQAQLPNYQRAFAETYGRLARDLTERYATDPPHALFFLRPEEQNLMQALRLAAQFTLWSVMHDLLLALEKLFVPAGHWKEWAWLITNLSGLPEIQSPSTLSDPAAAALHQYLLRCRAAVARHQHDDAAEGKYLAHCQELCVHQRDLRGSAEILYLLGELAHRQADHARAIDYFQESLAFYRRLADSAGAANQAHTLSRMGRLALQRHDLNQAREWLSQGENLLDSFTDPRLRADILDGLGTLAYMENAFDDAENHYQQSLTLRDGLGLRSEQAAVLYNLGLVAERRKDLPAARQRHEQSLELATSVGDVPAQLQSLLQLASIAFLQGNLQEAERRCGDALNLAEAHPAPRDAAEIHYRLGRIAHELCQSDEAVQKYRLSLDLYRGQNDLENYLKVLGYLANVPGIKAELLISCYRHSLTLAEHHATPQAQLKILYRLAALAESQEHWLDAEHCYRRCLSLEQATGSKNQEAFLLQKLGLILGEQGRPAEAVLLFQRSVQLAGFPNGDQPFHTNVLERLGRAALDKREFEEALLYFQHGVKLALDSGDITALAKANLGLGHVAVARADLEHAQAWFQAALDVSVEGENRRDETDALIALGDLARRRQQWKEAERRYTAALKNLQLLHDDAGHAATLVHLAEVAEEQGRQKKAVQLLEQAAALFTTLQDAPSLYRTRTALQRLQA